MLVAPRAGAWIETRTKEKDIQDAASHPARVRGLKRAGLAGIVATCTSHPARVRGLKRRYLPAVACRRGRTPRGCVD